MSSQVRQRDGKSANDTPNTPQAASSPAYTAGKGEAGAAKLLVNEESTKKWRGAWVRTYTTILMLGGFVFLFALGHIPLMMLVISLQVLMFKEVKRLSKVLSTQQALPSFRPLHWYWFFTAMFFSYGRVLASSFHFTIPYHSFITFALYMAGVVVFVLSLETGYYKYQFEMFAWVHLTLLLIVFQSTFIVSNMFQGLIWSDESEQTCMSALKYAIRVLMYNVPSLTNPFGLDRSLPPILLSLQVHPAISADHLERHMGVHLRFLLRPHASHPAVA